MTLLLVTNVCLRQSFSPADNTLMLGWCFTLCSLKTPQRVFSPYIALQIITPWGDTNATAKV